MKRLLFAVIILSSIFVSHAQKYTYCTLHSFHYTLSPAKKGMTVFVDYGKGGLVITDSLTGKIRYYQSIVEAVNEFSLDGWEFVQTQMLVVDPKRSIPQWIMRKKLPQEETEKCPESQS